MSSSPAVILAAPSPVGTPTAPVPLAVRMEVDPAVVTQHAPTFFDVLAESSLPLPEAAIQLSDELETVEPPDRSAEDAARDGWLELLAHATSQPVAPPTAEVLAVAVPVGTASVATAANTTRVEAMQETAVASQVLAPATAGAPSSTRVTADLQRMVAPPPAARALPPDEEPELVSKVAIPRAATREPAMPQQRPIAPAPTQPVIAPTPANLPTNPAPQASAVPQVSAVPQASAVPLIAAAAEPAPVVATVIQADSLPTRQRSTVQRAVNASVDWSAPVSPLPSLRRPFEPVGKPVSAAALPLTSAAPDSELPVQSTATREPGVAAPIATAPVSAPVVAVAVPANPGTPVTQGNAIGIPQADASKLRSDETADVSEWGELTASSEHRAAPRASSVDRAPQLQARHATLTLSQPLGTAAWTTELATRVSLLVRSAKQSATLKLNPADLGPVEVRISVRESDASVTFVAAHADTRAALEQAMPKLRDMLASQGLALADSAVFADSQRSFNSSQPQPQRAGNEAAPRDERPLEAAEAAKGPGASLLDIYA
ncbi:MAG TPA: flagellar hook-length control protein FliK [Steroidobacteraceae bacterium]|nr:flagellar hook-length control protein FliK [Steroidobacteraceae bacterium]